MTAVISNYTKNVLILTKLIKGQMKKVIVLIFLLAIFLVVPRNYFAYAEEKKSDKTNIGKISVRCHFILGFEIEELNFTKTSHFIFPSTQNF